MPACWKESRTSSAFQLSSVHWVFIVVTVVTFLHFFVLQQFLNIVHFPSDENEKSLFSQKSVLWWGTLNGVLKHVWRMMQVWMPYYTSCVFFASLSNTFGLEVVDHSFPLSVIMEKGCSHPVEQEVVSCIVETCRCTWHLYIESCWTFAVGFCFLELLHSPQIDGMIGSRWLCPTSYRTNPAISFGMLPSVSMPHILPATACIHHTVFTMTEKPLPL